MDDPELFLDVLHPTMETHLLARYVKPKPGQKVVELGCGNGYISLFLAFKYPDIERIVAMDIHEEHIKQAKETFLQLKYFLHTPLAPLELLTQDIRNESFKQKFDIVVCNPPFFPRKASRPSPDSAKQQARQDFSLTREDLFSAVSQCLLLSGHLYLVFPSTQLEDYITVAQKFQFQLSDKIHYPEIRKRSGGIHLTTFIPSLTAV